MLRLAADADMARLEKVMQDLSDLVDRLDGCGAFGAGPNRDFEGKSIGFGYGFTFDARDAAALATYAKHPEHVALGGQLVAMCDGGADGITVYDLEVLE